MKTMSPHECAATKVCKRCQEEKPVSEYRVQVVNRSNGVTTKWTHGKCKSCERDYHNARNAANRGRQNELSRESYRRNRKTVLARTKAYYESNKEKYREWRYIREAQQTDEQRQARLDQQRDWRNARLDETRARWSEKAARRKAATIQATPKWADFDEIDKMYIRCQELNKATDLEWHVDHIIPLVNEAVCGLHCEDNLRIVTASENHRKSNKLVDDICCSPVKA